MGRLRTNRVFGGVNQLDRVPGRQYSKRANKDAGGAERGNSDNNRRLRS